MDRKDPLFRDLNGAIQVRFRELREEGVGANVQHVSVVTPDEERTLWESQVIGDHSPNEIREPFFSTSVKHFAYEVVKSSANYDPDCYTYVEHGSKNNSGTNVKQTNKTVPVCTCPDARPSCLVYLL